MDKHANLKKWQQTKWYSEVVVAEDMMHADYELKVEAWSPDGKHVEVVHKYPVT